MIGLDTNILLRHLQQDDPAQSEKASILMASLGPENRGFIAITALIELVWVLNSSFQIDRAGLGDVVERLLQSKDVVIERSGVVWSALHLFRSSKADFADCLIERSGRFAGCDYTATYDRSAARTSGMRLLR